MSNFFKVTVIAMGEHITKPSKIYPMDTLYAKEARSEFEQACEHFGCDNQKYNEDGTATAGGIGYDYRVELEKDLK